MQADLALKTRQAVSETPRNIAILLTAVAAIAGFLGFKLGQREPASQPVMIQVPAAPATSGK